MSWSRSPKQDLEGNPELVRAAALRYLGRREYTAVELRQRLKERGAAVEDIETVLDYVQERGYQSDARAGESHIRGRLQYAPRGRSLLRRELQARGVSAELCVTLLQEYYPPEREVLRCLLAKEAALKAEQLQADDAQQARRLRQKMVRRLLAKGFGQATVMEELAEWLPPPDDDDYL